MSIDNIPLFLTSTIKYKLKFGERKDANMNFIPQVQFKIHIIPLSYFFVILKQKSSHLTKCQRKKKNYNITKF